MTSAAATVAVSRLTRLVVATGVRDARFSVLALSTDAADTEPVAVGGRRDPQHAAEHRGRKREWLVSHGPDRSSAGTGRRATRSVPPGPHRGAAEGTR